MNLPKNLMSPIIKWSASTGSIKVCLPVKTKWIQTRKRINPKEKRQSMRLEFEKIWKRIHKNLMKTMKESSFQDVFTYTVMEKVKNPKTKKATFFVSAYFKIPENKNESDFDLSCSDSPEDKKICAYFVYTPPTCFISISPKKKVDKSYSIPISKQLGQNSLGIHFFEELQGCSC